MGSEQKFLEDKEITYFHDEDFTDAIHAIAVAFDGEVVFDLLHKIKSESYALPLYDWKRSYQTAGLYVESKKEHIFFELAYIKEEIDYCILIDVQEIDSDAYLDHVLANTTI